MTLSQSVGRSTSQIKTYLYSVVLCNTGKSEAQSGQTAFFFALGLTCISLIYTPSKPVERLVQAAEWGFTMAQ